MIFDLSHTISSKMPVYPESPPPKIYDLGLQEDYGVNVQFYEIEGHIGTHLDTPKHLFTDLDDTSTFSVEKFFGKAILIDCCDCSNSGIIGIDYLSGIHNLNNYQFVIFKTGWHLKWGSIEYFSNFPVPSPEVINILIKANVFGIGLDTISIDKVENLDLTNHKQWLSQNRIIIENLTNLEILPQNEFEFSCFPVKFENGDGSPVRAVAKV